MSKQVTVAEASPSPPPLPKEPLPSTDDITCSSAVADTNGETAVVDQPITSLGDGESDEEGDEEDEEVWDPSEERLPGDVSISGKKRDKGKGKLKQEESVPGVVAADGAHPWQAVWSAEKNAWYFWNTTTGEVTWTNPLAPSSSTQPPLPNEPAPRSLPVQPSKRGGIPDIDPGLAWLLPSESRYLPGSSGSGEAELQMANFNARSGRFSANDNTYAVDHLDEYNREKKFNSRYFDQDKWEKEMRERNMKRSLEVAEGKQPQISKKDMDRFKKKRQEKRLRSQAWLRD